MIRKIKDKKKYALFQNELGDFYVYERGTSKFYVIEYREDVEELETELDDGQISKKWKELRRA